MSSAEAQIVANRSASSELNEAQETFARQFDLSQPDEAMSSYQKFVFPAHLFYYGLKLTRE